MDKWHRIYDDEVAAFGDHSWRFKFPGGDYTLIIIQSEQSKITVKYHEITETWPVQLKEKKGAKYKLSGMADWVPEIIDNVYWYELLICPNPKITYWGDRVIYRTDLCIKP